jgi:lipoprotein-releasing system ATP-binding protein
LILWDFLTPMTETVPILSAKAVCRDFVTPEKTLSVLKGVELSLNQGEVISVMGPSGVGKSTLLHILGGLDQPTAGEVRISGELLSSMSESERARFRNRKLGFVFQFHYLMDDFTAAENVMIPMLVAGLTNGEAKGRGELLLEQVGLTDRMDHLPKELSGGEQQRVAVARALANNPDLILADEPSGNLDTETGRKLHELIFQLNSENGTTFVVATHNRELADKCTRRLIMKDGRVIDE